jgi:hypothetical protein
MKFFTYDQCKSGNIYNVDDNIGHFVIIEAESYKQANERAKEVGVYFDGVSKKMDCACCGDRWCAQWHDDDGKDTPEIYGSPVSKYQFRTEKQYRIHKADGTITKGVTYTF